MHGVPWNTLIGYASDTASVMVGKYNSVLSRLLSKQLKLFSLGCLCHLGALCAAAGLKKLPVSLDELLIDISISLSILQRDGMSLMKFKLSSVI